MRYIEANPMGKNYEGSNLVYNLLHNALNQSPVCFGGETMDRDEGKK